MFPLALFTRIPATLLQGKRIIIIIITICIYNAVAPGPEKPSDLRLIPSSHLVVEPNLEGRFFSHVSPGYSLPG